MDKDLKQSSKEEQWISYSEGDVSQLAPWMSRQLSALGVKNAIDENMGMTYIQSSAFNIRFYPKSYGCELHIYIFKENEDVFLFREFWKHIVNKDIVWGGPYKKGLPNTKTKEQEATTIKKPWELMLGEGKDMIKIVRLWCTTDMPGAEIAKVVSIGETTLSNYLSDLRNKYPNAGIPKGLKERNKYLREWEKYNQH